jgi:hypothetical protein
LHREIVLHDELVELLRARKASENRLAGWLAVIFAVIVLLVAYHISRS